MAAIWTAEFESKIDTNRKETKLMLFFFTGEIEYCNLVQTSGVYIEQIDKAFKSSLLQGPMGAYMFGLKK